MNLPCSATRDVFLNDSACWGNVPEKVTQRKYPRHAEGWINLTQT